MLRPASASEPSAIVTLLALNCIAPLVRRICMYIMQRMALQSLCMAPNYSVTLSLTS